MRKYRDTEDLSPKQPVKKRRSGKIDEYAPIIDKWLEEDKRTWHKHRHTAKRIHERLLEEFGAKISYSTVQSYVREKKEQATQVKDQYLDLVWAPGETQADFGEADIYWRGVLTRIYYLVLTFPYSNVGVMQIFRGESAECVCQGLKDIFSFVNGIPRAIIFDNATGIGRRVGEMISTSKLFGAFAAHYGFSFRFCNPDSGNEKGAVENMVGAMRRSLLVPRPSIENIKSYNVRLFEKCLDYCNKPHYRKSEGQLQLFIEDRVVLCELPQAEFKVICYERPRTDKKGRICLDGRHWYSTDPALASKRVVCAIGAFDMAIYTEDGAYITTHTRSFGTATTDVSEPASQLALLCRKPGGWINSQVRYSLPDVLRTFMDELPKADLKRTLLTMRDVSALSGYRPTVDAMAQVAKSVGALDEVSITVLAAGIAGGRGVVEYDDVVDMDSYDKVFTLALDGER